MPDPWWKPVAAAITDGTPNTSGTAASCLPAAAVYTFRANTIYVGTIIRIQAQGRISNVVTTPGTARLDVRLGGTVVFDTGALTLNAVVKTTLPWWFDCQLICRTVGSGTSATLFGFGEFHSESVVASALASAGGSGSLLSAAAAGPETAPAVGGGFDSTADKTLDMFFTQTVGTGSFTLHNYLAEVGFCASAS